VSWSDVRLE
jgi:hypothetical protein